MKDKWKQLRKEDRTFGTMKRKAEFDIDIDLKCREAIKNSVLRPYQDPLDCVQTVQFIFGRYIAFRGAKEHHELKHEHVFRSVYGPNNGEDLEGLNYYAIKVDEDKMNQLGFENPKCAPDQTHLLSCCENLKDELFDQVAIVDFYIDKCHDGAVYFYAKIGTKKQQERWSKECRSEIWYGPATPASSGFKVGINPITKNFKNSHANEEQRTGRNALVKE